jgi:hypothetical protein
VGCRGQRGGRARGRRGVDIRSAIASFAMTSIFICLLVSQKLSTAERPWSL